MKGNFRGPERGGVTYSHWTISSRIVKICHLDGKDLVAQLQKIAWNIFVDGSGYPKLLGVASVHIYPCWYKGPHNALNFSWMYGMRLTHISKRVATQPGKPWEMAVRLGNLEKSWGNGMTLEKEASRKLLTFFLGTGTMRQALEMTKID